MVASNATFLGCNRHHNHCNEKPGWLFRPASPFVGAGGRSVACDTALQAVQDLHRHPSLIPLQVAKQSQHRVQGFRHLVQRQAGLLFCVPACPATGAGTESCDDASSACCGSRSRPDPVAACLPGSRSRWPSARRSGAPGGPAGCGEGHDRGTPGSGPGPPRAGGVVRARLRGPTGCRGT